MSNEAALRLAQIRERLAAATPWPWYLFAHQSLPEERSICSQHGPCEDCPPFPHCHSCVVGAQAWQREADADLIANAPLDLAWAVGEIERLAAKVEENRLLAVLLGDTVAGVGRREILDAVCAAIDAREQRVAKEVGRAPL